MATTWVPARSPSQPLALALAPPLPPGAQAGFLCGSEIPPDRNGEKSRVLLNNRATQAGFFLPSIGFVSPPSPGTCTYLQPASTHGGPVLVRRFARVQGAVEQRGESVPQFLPLCLISPGPSLHFPHLLAPRPCPLHLGCQRVTGSLQKGLPVPCAQLSSEGSRLQGHRDLTVPIPHRPSRGKRGQAADPAL